MAGVNSSATVSPIRPRINAQAHDRPPSDRHVLIDSHSTRGGPLNVVVGLVAGALSIMMLFGLLVYGLGCVAGTLSGIGKTTALVGWFMFATPIVLLMVLAIGVPAAAFAKRRKWTSLRFVASGALVLGSLVTVGWLGIFPPDSARAMTIVLLSGACAGAAAGAVLWDCGGQPLKR